MSNKIINIILVFIVVIFLILDALAIHDVLVGEPDLLYEFGVIILSIFVFAAIIIYKKQRKHNYSQTS